VLVMVLPAGWAVRSAWGTDVLNYGLIGKASASEYGSCSSCGFGADW
jgi:hypothetical protein